MRRISAFTRRPLLLLPLALAGALCALPAEAAEPGPERRARSTRVRPAPPRDHGETPADRARRLRQECRGLPNAGACAGYGYGSGGD